MLNFADMTLIGALASWGMFWAGAGLMSVPIIIHLLNKRRFKIVDWAAMDFLFDADKRNRRRVRLENLILLLLRCLVMFLLGLLLARPSLPRSVTEAWVETQQFEHIVLLDDSLSMQVQDGDQTSMEAAKKKLEEFAEHLRNNTSDDKLTLILTSNLDDRPIRGERVDESSIEEIRTIIKGLQTSDSTANLQSALRELERHLVGGDSNVNRVVYVITDLRRQDWGGEDAGDAENQPVNMIKQFAEKSSAFFIVDVGAEANRNLAVTEIEPDDRLVAGVMSQFAVTVTNFGDEEATNIGVRFYVNDTEVNANVDNNPTIISKIQPGESRSVDFFYTFSREVFADEDFDLGTSTSKSRNDVRKPFKIRAEVAADQFGDTDRFAPDDSRFYAARVARGTPLLIVDGAPSATQLMSESTFLRSALDPPGSLSSGFLVDVVTDSEFESSELDKYRVIFLCNVDLLSDQRITDLENWVKAGGGLVIMPGDLVDENVFNRLMYKDGNGLSPIRLLGWDGDETQQTWVHFDVEARNHPVLSFFEGQDGTVLNLVKVFVWWNSEADKARLGKDVTVPAKFVLEDREAPAMAEKSFGDGRVFALTVPADRDWTDWPNLTIYLPMFHLLVPYLAGGAAVEETGVRVGEPIRHMIDLARYKRDATILLPDGSQQAVAASAVEDAKKDGSAAKPPPSVTDPAATAENDGRVWQIDVPQTPQRGFYEMQLERTSSGEDGQLFAVNIDSREGKLERVNLVAFESDLDDSAVRLVRGDSELGALDVSGADDPMWMYVLALVAIVLCVEQFLGWFFGLRR